MGEADKSGKFITDHSAASQRFVIGGWVTLDAMPEIQRLALLPYSAVKMYDLVRDVPRYPEFLSWCVTAKVHEENADRQVASLRVRLGGLETVFMTENRLQPGSSLEMRLIDGPFTLLEGAWRFVPLGEAGCRVALNLRFEFNRRWLGIAFQRGFAHIADRLVDDFCRRAEMILAIEPPGPAPLTPSINLDPDSGQARSGTDPELIQS